MSASPKGEVFEEIVANVTAPPASDGEYLDMVHELYLIIPNPQLNAILVMPGDEDDRVVFPVVEPTAREVGDWQTHPQELQRFVYEKLSTRVRIMFQHFEPGLPPRNENHSGVQVNLVCQLLDHSFVPSLPLRWCSEEEIVKTAEHLQWSEDPYDFVYVDSKKVLMELKGFPTFIKATEPWHKISWLSFISEWTKNTLEEEGYELVVGPRSVHYGSVSHIMGCKARRIRPFSDMDKRAIETLYVKATIPELGEVQRTVTIARECPDITGEVVAWDCKRGLMILRDIGSPSTYYVSPKVVFGTMRKLQSLSEAQLKQLKDGGVHVRDARWYTENIEGLLEAAGKTDIACDKRVVDALQYLTENIETLKRMIRDCNRWNLPNVLVHGDMHPDNYGRFVKEGEGGYHKLFDWDRAFIGSPLIDLSIAVWEQAPRFEKPLIDNMEELDMPWKSMIPDGEWAEGFRNVTRVQNMLVSFELFRYYLSVHDSRQTKNFTWNHVGTDFQRTVAEFARYLKFIDNHEEKDS